MPHATPLHDSLHKLREEIRSLAIGDEAARQRLEALLGDVERTVGPQGTRGEQASLNERLNAAVLGFEATHPRIAGVLNELAQELGNMGI